MRISKIALEVLAMALAKTWRQQLFQEESGKGRFRIAKAGRCQIICRDNGSSLIDQQQGIRGTFKESRQSFWRDLAWGRGGRWRFGKDPLSSGHLSFSFSCSGSSFFMCVFAWHYEGNTLLLPCILPQAEV